MKNRGIPNHRRKMAALARAVTAARRLTRTPGPKTGLG